MTSTLQDSGSLSTQAPFSIVNNFLLAHLADNFAEADLDSLETRLLNALCERRSLSGVIFDFSEVITTDRQDLQRLAQMLMAIKLLGVRVGLCGINPGMAAVMVKTRLHFDREIIGCDIDDLLQQL
jgi:anti-anti-sigma regulatory factor